MAHVEKTHSILTLSAAVAPGGGGRGGGLRALSTAVAFLFFLVVLYTGSPPTKPSYHALFLSLADNATAARHLLALTRRPHVAGTPANSDTADYVLSALSAASLPSHSASYDVLLTYPAARSLSLSSRPFALRQDTYPGDPYAEEAPNVLPSFHAYAASGTAVGPAVFANYGRVEDFATLLSYGVNFTNTVAVARYGQIFRGDIVRNAQDAGAAGVIIFTDSKDYGGSAAYFPDAKWMPPTGVQVGSVYAGKGDPTTPGWPSRSGSERLSKEEVAASGLMPRIPSLPVSSRDGEEIMRAVGGKVAPVDWQGGEGAPEYHIGPGPGVLNLSYSGIEKLTAIHNVFAVIEGEEEPDRYVLLGNHRDAWTFGAVDPNSGTAALLEIAERLGKLQQRGWRPRRTIVLCNWDAEEYGLIGSTEWVEENLAILASRAVVYINVDCGVSGPGFHAFATPQLDELIKEATKKVPDPDNSSQTIYDSWSTSNDSPLLERLGDDESDYAAFLHHVGVPSAGMAFGEGYPVYHSMYDDFVWMQKFGDPMFHRHAAVASTWGLVALKLADMEILPFDYVNYASELQASTKTSEDEVRGMPVSFAPLYKSIEELKKAATTVDNQRKELGRCGWALEWGKTASKVRELNDRLMMAERAFTDRDGLSEREWYKHLIYGPSKHDGYGSDSFPGIVDAIEKAKSLNTTDSFRSVQHEVWRVARVVTQAALVLNGKLT